MPESKLNPNVAEVEIGTRNIRSIKIYPLSVGDQLKTTDLVIKGMTAFVNRDESGLENEVAFMKYMVGLFQENVGKILTLASDEENGEALLDEMTNEQILTIAELIYKVNYEETLKKTKNLVQKIRSQFRSMKSSPQSLNDTQATDLKTSSESPSKTVD